MFAALQERNYRLYFSGSILSNIGTWMQRVAQDWLVLELSGGSALAVGITTALQFLPTLVLAGVTGLAADRFDKRTVLRVTQAWMAASAIVLGVLAMTGAAQTWHVFAIALVFGVGSAFDIPARQSFVPEVVGPAKLPNAIALNSAAFNTARLIGPAVAGLVIANFGSGVAILSNGISYLAFILALSMFDSSKLQRSVRVKRGKRQIREALSYVRHRRDILLILGVTFFIGTFGLNFQMTSALMATEIYGKGAEEYGILGTIMAIGSLTGALVGARRKESPRLRFFLVMAVAFGVMTVVSGVMPTYVTYAITLPFVGVCSMLAMNAANTIVQLSVDPQLRGRVMALYVLVMMGGTPIGAPLLGVFGQLLNARFMLIIGGGVVVVGTLVVMVLLAHRQGIMISTELSPYLHWRPGRTTEVAAATAAEEPAEITVPDEGRDRTDPTAEFPSYPPASADPHPRHREGRGGTEVR
ncbi:MFS transporter [Microlunatus sp. Y2014]|uniref:MFS transporter n=1 Tax=Microlunatus sp. Y2014 TaxID=3418488 RepID=UPI003DA767CA